MTRTARDVVKNLLQLVGLVFGAGAAVALIVYLLALPLAVVHWIARAVGVA